MTEALPNWPAVMTTQRAARYLDISENSFRALAKREGVRPLDLGMVAMRWRRADLDNMVDRLSLQGDLAEAAEAADSLEAVHDRAHQFYAAKRRKRGK
jgi:hypothetical protein